MWLLENTGVRSFLCRLWSSPVRDTLTSFLLGISCVEILTQSRHQTRAKDELIHPEERVNRLLSPPADGKISLTQLLLMVLRMYIDL